MYSPTFFAILPDCGPAEIFSISGLMIIGWAQPAPIATATTRRASRNVFMRDLLECRDECRVRVERGQQLLHDHRIALLRARNRDRADERGLPLVVNRFDLVVLHL